MNDLIKRENRTIDFSKALSNDMIFEKAMQRASLLAKSNFIPKTFQNNPSDCLIALMMSAKMKIDPITLMGEMHVIHGKPGLSAKFLIAQANRSGTFQGNIKFKSTGTGDSLNVTAYATLKCGEIAEGEASMAMAKAEGWVSKNSKYRSMPKHMLEYRAATFLVRKYCPEVTMGFTTQEEATDTAPISVSQDEIKKNLLASAGVDQDLIDTRKKMVDAFFELDVSEKDVLENFAYEKVDQITWNDIEELKTRYADVKDMREGEKEPK